jgi:hypothetical protein
VLADLDDDSRTADNVVVHSNIEKGKIQAIDGYHLAPPQHKVASRAEYDLMPTRKERELMHGEHRKDFKAYFRKYPTPGEQIQHPFESFERDINTFSIVNDVIKALMNAAWDLTLFSVKQHPDGKLALKHHMAILQKVTSYANKCLMVLFFNKSGDYDFEVDEDDLKSKKNQARYKRYLQTPAESTYFGQVELDLVRLREFLYKFFIQVIVEINALRVRTQ